MVTPALRAEKRTELVQEIGSPILLVANGHRARNLVMSHVPFRQDSTFLYFTGCNVPGAAVLLTEQGHRIYLPAQHADDPLWHGIQPSIEDQATLGFDEFLDCLRRLGRLRPPLLRLAVPDDRRMMAAQLTGLNLISTEV